MSEENEPTIRCCRCGRVTEGWRTSEVATSAICPPGEGCQIDVERLEVEPKKPKRKPPTV